MLMMYCSLVRATAVHTMTTTDTFKFLFVFLLADFIAFSFVEVGFKEI